LKLNKLVLPLVVAIVLSSFAITFPAAAQPPSTRVKVEHEQNIFYTNTTSLNEHFTIQVNIENVASMYGWEFQLYWRRQIIKAVSATVNIPSTWGVNYAGPFGSGIENEYNTTHGRYWIGLSAKAPAPVFNGNTTMATIEFQIIKLPPPGGNVSSSLTLKPPPGMTYLLIDKTANEIPHEFIHGQYMFISTLAQPKLCVSPERIVNPALTPCNNFTVDVNIADVVELYSFEFKLGFNASVLHAIDAVLGDFFPPIVIPLKEINNTEGYVWFYATLTSLEPPKNGSGTLAKITFHVENSWFTDLQLYDTYFFDQLGTPLPVETASGYFNNILMPKLYVDPPEIIDPTLLPPSTFSIDIKATSIDNFYGFSFYLGYDTYVLNTLGILINPLDNETNFIVEISIKDAEGTVWVNLTYQPPAEPINIENATLVTIVFQVANIGETPLDLYNTTLRNPQGEPIPHEVGDGYFAVLIRDVAVIKIELSATQVYEGRKVNILVTVKNEGDIAESFNVTVYYDGNIIGEQSVINLPSEANTTLTFIWNTNGVPPCHNYTISAKASKVPYEFDISDNSLDDGAVKIKIMGDINGDGIVNIKDVIIVSAAFGSVPGDPNWDPTADVNEDKVINVKDMVLISVNYGRTC
jgi:hypothetical protein